MAPTSVTVVMVPRFPLHALALCIDTLRIANRESPRTLFDWTLATTDGDPVPSSAGIAISPGLAIAQIAFSPVTIVLAAYEPERACTPALLGWLRRQDRRGGAIGCVDTGAVILGRAGLLRRGETSVHPEALDGLREDFPSGRFNDHRYTFASRRFSSAGGIGILDMMLALVEHHAGATHADRVARVMAHDRRARAREPGGPSEPHAPRLTHRALARCVDLMHGHIEEPLALGTLGDEAGVPPWTLRRLFRRHVGVSPGVYYRRLRLRRARQLLAYSHLPIADVATACGFVEPASFSRAYRREFGVLPSHDRRDDAGLPREGHGA